MFRRAAEEMRDAVRKHLWDGEWYARGITDDGRLFGVSWDEEGRIFLNPQSWALLTGTANPKQAKKIRRAVTRELGTPDGPMLLAPPFTRMHEDIGRVTQKSPGVSENGSVYNHAAAFWIFSLYQQGETEQAFDLLRTMVPGPGEAEYRRRGQLPVFLPNYYRGYRCGNERTAGRSSQLVNTGTIAWMMRCVVEGLFGLRGSRKGLEIAPRIPRHWNEVSLQRRYLGALFDVTMLREAGRTHAMYVLDGIPLESPLIPHPEAGRRYALEIHLPEKAE
jgi:cellobionic acid phosphorylase